MSKTKVLVVDDVPKIGRMFKTALEEEGIDVDMATDGETAIQKVKENQYDVVFMDIIMPGLNGVQTLEKIREFNRDVKVVMITGYSLPEMIEKAKEYGMYVSLSKPVSIDAMMKVINDIKKTEKETAMKEKRCLVIDQKASLDISVFAALENSGFEVRIFSNFTDAFKEHLPDFELLILNTDPNHEEYRQSISKIQESFPKEKIIVFVDTTEEEELMEGAFNIGAQRYLCGSASKNEIKKILKELG